MPKCAFITGITGQDGSFLADLLLRKGYEVHGIVRRNSSLQRTRIDHLRNKITLHYGDMTDYSSLLSAITESKPDEIYNLAAQSHVKISFDMPDYTQNVNAMGCQRLLDIITKVNKNIRFYQASTSEMFGDSYALTSHSPYGSSKIFAYTSVINYRQAYGLFACNGILFNHESERRGENFLTRKITLGLKRILNGEQEFIEVGNIYPQRDWGYAPEYVEAIWLFLQQEKPHDLFIGTGETRSVKEFINAVFDEGDFQLDWKKEAAYDQNGILRVKINSKFFRPMDINFLKADTRRAKEVLGWEAKTKFNDLVKILVQKELS